MRTTPLDTIQCSHNMTELLTHVLTTCVKEPPNTEANVQNIFSVHVPTEGLAQAEFVREQAIIYYQDILTVKGTHEGKVTQTTDVAFRLPLQVLFSEREIIAHFTKALTEELKHYLLTEIRKRLQVEMNRVFPSDAYYALEVTGKISPISTQMAARELVQVLQSKPSLTLLFVNGADTKLIATIYPAIQKWKRSILVFQKHHPQKFQRLEKLFRDPQSSRSFEHKIFPYMQSKFKYQRFQMHVIQPSKAFPVYGAIAEGRVNGVEYVLLLSAYSGYLILPTYPIASVYYNLYAQSIDSAMEQTKLFPAVQELLKTTDLRTK